MTHKQRVLDLLSDGAPHSHHELYGLHVIAHSRVADLRRDGYVIEQWRDGDDYMYRLASPLDDRDAGSDQGGTLPAAPSPAASLSSSGEHAPGWAGGADPVVDCAAPLVIDGQLCMEVAA